MKRRKAWKFGLLFLAFMLSGMTAWMLSANLVTATSALSTVDPVFQPILSSLNKTQAPLRLPAFIFLESIRESGLSTFDGKVYANLLDVTPTTYVVILGATEECQGGNACRLGSISGSKNDRNTPRGENLLKLIKSKYNASSNRRSKEKPEVVTLAKGIKGYFDPWTCGASCGDADIIWDENGYRYTVGSKIGTKSSLVKMANSAIANLAKAP